MNLVFILHSMNKFSKHLHKWNLFVIYKVHLQTPSQRIIDSNIMKYTPIMELLECDDMQVGPTVYWIIDACTSSLLM